MLHNDILIPNSICAKNIPLALISSVAQEKAQQNKFVNMSTTACVSSTLMATAAAAAVRPP